MGEYEVKSRKSIVLLERETAVWYDFVLQVNGLVQCSTKRNGRGKEADLFMVVL